MKLNSMQDLFIEQLNGMYSAELQLTEALPKMAGAASSMTLAAAFEQHLVETEEHVNRIERIFSMLGTSPTTKTCKAMEGLVAEGSEIIASDGDDSVRDAALIAGAQRVEHYEISAYGTLKSMAEMLGKEDIVTLIENTLDEEKAADSKLTGIAESEVNVAAASASSRG